jgi:hypothetical protein
VSELIVNAQIVPLTIAVSMCGVCGLQVFACRRCGSLKIQQAVNGFSCDRGTHRCFECVVRTNVRGNQITEAK